MNTVTTLFISGFVVEAATQSNLENNDNNHNNDNNLGSLNDNVSLSPIDGNSLNLVEENYQKFRKSQKSKSVESHLTESLLQNDNDNDDDDGNNNSDKNNNKKQSNDKSNSSLKRLASRLTRFMSPLHSNPINNNKDNNNSIQDEEEESVDNNNQYSLNHECDAISLLPKESSTRNITTAKEGGKLYIISMPNYSRAGTTSFDSLANEDAEVGKKFMKRIESLYMANTEANNSNNNNNDH